MIEFVAISWIARLSTSAALVRVYDASMHGCRIEFAKRPQAMETLHITFDGLAPLEARVYWVNEHCAGLKFSNPIRPAVFNLVVERLRQAA